jgi:hypothetical protein
VSTVRRAFTVLAIGEDGLELITLEQK